MARLACLGSPLAGPELVDLLLEQAPRHRRQLSWSFREHEAPLVRSMWCVRSSRARRSAIAAHTFACRTARRRSVESDRAIGAQRGCAVRCAPACWAQRASRAAVLCAHPRSCPTRSDQQVLLRRLVGWRHRVGRHAHCGLI